MIWVAGRGTAETAGPMLAATLGGSAAAPIVVGAEAPPWIGALDVLIVAGDDPGDPALVAAAATGVRRGARVVVVAPYEGPLRDATAGRAAVLEPRLSGPRRVRAVPATWPPAWPSCTRSIPALRIDLAALADELDAEALRNSAGRELFTNPAKTLADAHVRARGGAGRRLRRRRWRWPGTAARSCCGSRTRWSRPSGWPTRWWRCARGLESAQSDADRVDALFHDEEIDGPLPDRLRTLRADAGRRARGGGGAGRRARRRRHGRRRGCARRPVADGRRCTARGDPEQQLAMLAVRLEMAAVYLRLVRG